MTEIKTRYFKLSGAAAEAAQKYQDDLDAMFDERKKWVDDTFGARAIYSLNREQIAALAVRDVDGKKIPGLRQKEIMTRDEDRRPRSVVVWVPDAKSKLGKEYKKKFESFKRPSLTPISEAMGMGGSTHFWTLDADRNNRYIVHLHVAHVGGVWYAAAPDDVFTVGEEPGHPTNKPVTVDTAVCEHIPEWQWLKALADDEARQAENKKAS